MAWLPVRLMPQMPAVSDLPHPSTPHESTWMFAPATVRRVDMTGTSTVAPKLAQAVERNRHPWGDGPSGYRGTRLPNDGKQPMRHPNWISLFPYRNMGRCLCRLCPRRHAWKRAFPKNAYTRQTVVGLNHGYRAKRPTTGHRNRQPELCSGFCAPHCHAMEQVLKMSRHLSWYKQQGVDCLCHRVRTKPGETYRRPMPDGEVVVIPSADPVHPFSSCGGGRG